MEQFIDGPLESCELINEKGNYYLKLVYNYENDSYKYKITFPRVPLPINKLDKIIYEHKCDRVPIDLFMTGDLIYCDIVTSGISGGYSRRFKVDKVKESYIGEYGNVIDMSLSPHFYVIEELEKKRKKMTLEEIEKELGCKIELVSDKNSHI